MTSVVSGTEKREIFSITAEREKDEIVLQIDGQGSFTVELIGVWVKSARGARWEVREDRTVLSECGECVRVQL